jgi:Na+-driven multidrug efflux pump
MWIALIMVGSLSGASAINMSIRLGKLDPNGARQAGYVGIVMSAGILIILSLGILIQSQWFARIFTNDPIFLEMFREASLPFTFTLFFMNLAVAIERIPYSMGRTKEVFWMGFVASWGGMWRRAEGVYGIYLTFCTVLTKPAIANLISLGQVPAVILCTTYWRSDLVGLYSGMAIGYGLLVVLYGVIVLRR